MTRNEAINELKIMANLYEQDVKILDSVFGAKRLSDKERAMIENHRSMTYSLIEFIENMRPEIEEKVLTEVSELLADFKNERSKHFN